VPGPASPGIAFTAINPADLLIYFPCSPAAFGIGFKCKPAAFTVEKHRYRFADYFL